MVAASVKGGGLSRNVSSSDLVPVCEQTPADLVDKKEEAEPVLSRSLLVPMTMVGGMVYLTWKMASDMHVRLEANPNVNPIKEVWISGPIFFTAFYLQVVFFGKRFMKTQDPLKIKPFVFTYNLYQCLLNIVTVVEIIREVRSNKEAFPVIWGNSAHANHKLSFRISTLVWMHYNNKYVELLDTLWMILKKKDKQISFLHCYHHVLLIWVWFLCCHIEPGGDSYFGACVNSFIHVIMYAYYTLALLKVDCPWKRWITNCQMLQFAVCLAHAGFVFYYKTMDWRLPAAQAFVMCNMLVLFGHFYYKTYTKKAAEKALLSTGSSKTSAGSSTERDVSRSRGASVDEGSGKKRR